MNWRDYEDAVYEILRSRFPANEVGSDQMIPGRFSEIERQIDVAGRSTLLGWGMLGIVDCKCYSQRVDVKDVEAVIGMAADVRADIALIVTTVGYSDAALARAHNEPNVRVHLDIVTPEEAAAIGEAPASAMMYRGRIAAVLLAPSGWLATSNIVEGERVLPLDALCYFHPSDLHVEDAMRQRAIGWCHIEDNPAKTPGHLEHTLEIQNTNAHEFDPDAEIKTWFEPVGVMNAEALFRRIDYKGTGYVDFTFFAELDDNGLFWACVICPPDDAHRALARLRFIADSVMFAFAPDADPSDSHGVWQDFFPWRKERNGPKPKNEEG
jgi:hypothetical protein